MSEGKGAKRFCFGRNERIVDSRTFKEVMRSGRRQASKHLIVFKKETKNSFHRFGVVVGKEVGEATYRNRIKRWCREFFRLHKNDIKGSYDFVVLIRKGFCLRRYGEVERELRRHF